MNTSRDDDTTTLSNTDKDGEDDESYVLAVVLGVLFGIIGIALISFIIYKNYIKKKLKFK